VLTVITGPPCSGKSTYLTRHAAPGDILIDFDVIARAIGSPSLFDHPDPIRWVTIAARRAAIEAALRQHDRGARVWIVQTSISRPDMRRYVDAGAEIVTLSADKETLRARARAERPARWLELIEAWRPTPAPRGRRPSGRPLAKVVHREAYNAGRSSREYRRLRAEILAAAPVCWLCGHDGADAIDHVRPLSRGGSPTDPANLRPAHGDRGCPTCRRKCNASKGAGPGVSGDTHSRSW
jgi:5-methylcytosine-specific restriction endonuclease McrA